MQTGCNGENFSHAHTKLECAASAKRNHSRDETAGGGCCRGDTLDKFGVINLQMHQLAEELRPLLKFYAVHPKVLPNAATAHNGQLLGGWPM